MSNQVPAVYAAINRVQGEMAKTGISKARKNLQQNYQFRGIDDVYNALSPLLAEAGLCILPRMLHRELVERQSSKGGVLFTVTVEAEFDFVAASDGSKHVVRCYGEAMDSADKATNKAMSAAMKYACLITFLIPTEGDNDADAVTHTVVPKRERKPVTVEAEPVIYDHGIAIMAIASADTMDALKAAFIGMQRLCKSHGTPEQMADLVRAKDARKAELEAAA